MQAAEKLTVTNLRPSAVYGPRDADILAFFRTVNMGIIPQLGGVDKYLSLIHVRDLARAIIMAMDSDKTNGNNYFIADEKPYSWKEFSRIILEVLGKKGMYVPVPLSLLKGIAMISEGISSMTKKPALINSQKIFEIEANFWICSPEKAFNDFKYRSELDLEEGIADTIAWYKENKWM